MRMHKNAVKPSVHDKQLTARTACHFWIWVCDETPLGKFSELHRPLAVKFGPHDFAASECLRCTGAGTFGKHYFSEKLFRAQPGGWRTYFIVFSCHRILTAAILLHRPTPLSLRWWRGKGWPESSWISKVTWIQRACSMQHYEACTMIWAGLNLIC